MGSVAFENTIVLADIELFWYVVFIAYTDAYDFSLGRTDKEAKVSYYEDSTTGDLVKELLYERLIDDPSTQKFLLNQPGPIGQRLEAEAMTLSGVLWTIESDSCVNFMHHSEIGTELPYNMKVFSICFDDSNTF